MTGKNKKKPRNGAENTQNATAGQLTFPEVAAWDTPPMLSNSVEIGNLPAPIWTETKAQLIANYLRLFLLITKHGVYIDGFAGPQEPDHPEAWAAKLVIELTPPWMNRFFLCELAKTSFDSLSKMVCEQPEVRGRKIQYERGDFNQGIDKILASGAITDKTACFALLDQRSTECHWDTVKKLASHKRGDTKIELFYFFPTGWVHRAISETKDKSALDRWWGDRSWKDLEGTGHESASTLCRNRIQALGYRDVKSWPISSREGGEGRTMYHMIHATDHLEAPKLMYRAYTNLIHNVPVGEQTCFDFNQASTVS